MNDFQEKEKQTKESRPIFITGSVRSGTSILARGIMKGGNIPGYLEGCFINLLGGFLRVTDRNSIKRGGQLIDQRIMISRVNKKDFNNELSLWFKNQYEKWNTYSGQWVDKTADSELIYALPYIIKMWPKAKIIVMTRRPIENVASRIRKFPQRSFDNHCEGWRDAAEMWIESKKNLLPSSYIEIDQRDVALRPEEVADKISNFLELSKDQRDGILKVFKKDRPEDTGGNEALIKSLEEMDWTEEEKKLFRETCGPVAEKCGYSLEKKYYI